MRYTPELRFHRFVEGGSSIQLYKEGHRGDLMNLVLDEEDRDNDVLEKLLEPKMIPTRKIKKILDREHKKDQIAKRKKK